jgi:hypothetical protein
MNSSAKLRCKALHRLRETKQNSLPLVRCPRVLPSSIFTFIVDLLGA